MPCTSPEGHVVKMPDKSFLPMQALGEPHGHHTAGILSHPIPPHNRCRGIEFHDPEHTDPGVVALLSHPGLLARSSRSMLSIVDAPFDGTWRPEDFPNIVQLVVGA